MIETLRKARLSRRRVKTNSYSSIHNVMFQANVVYEKYDQILQLRTKDDKRQRSGIYLASLSSATRGITFSVQKCC